MDIVDAIWGVAINELNKYITEYYNVSTNSDEINIQYITSEVIHKLNSYQALTYARIRFNDSTFERDKRQRELIEGVA